MAARQEVIRKPLIERQHAILLRAFAAEIQKCFVFDYCAAHSKAVMLPTVFRIARRKPGEPDGPVAKVAKQISVPIVSARSSFQANRPRRVQRLKHFRQAPRHDYFLHYFGGQVRDGRTFGFVHGLDFIEVVVHGASKLAVKR